MPTDSESRLQLEIGHVLFIDIVGYSKLLIDEQRERIRALREIVRGTEQFRSAETEGKLVRLPTGDGGALVFRTSPEAPVSECCEQFRAHARAWKFLPTEHPRGCRAHTRIAPKSF